jgi:hypothetical protein
VIPPPKIKNSVHAAEKSGLADEYGEEYGDYDEEYDEEV